jgi:hypothetical protein
MYGECADSGEDVDSIMWSGEDHVEEEDHVWGRSHMSFKPSSARREQSATFWVCAEAEFGWRRWVGELYERLKSPNRRTDSFL